MMRNRRVISVGLIWLGVLAWLPFLYLLASGKDPSIYPFLSVHLLGVLGGTRLRAATDPEKRTKRHHPLQRVGRIMIILGVIAWVPYIYQKSLLGTPTEIAPFLATHLTGVLGGSALLLSRPVIRFLANHLTIR
jgi:hypothetical protein